MREFLDAAPYPHVVIDNYRGNDEVALAFPPLDHPMWKRRAYGEQQRYNAFPRDAMQPALRAFLAELIDAPFLDFLCGVAERRDLIADPRFTGAGPIATPRGGHLALHVDFNRDSARDLQRVLSILYYCPTTWDDAWGGELELWARDRSACVHRIAPRPDRLVIMAYGEDHWHGHPTPLACPDGVARQVVTAHYYAVGGTVPAHGAIW